MAEPQRKKSINRLPSVPGWVPPSAKEMVQRHKQWNSGQPLPDKGFDRTIPPSTLDQQFDFYNSRVAPTGGMLPGQTSTWPRIQPLQAGITPGELLSRSIASGQMRAPTGPTAPQPSLGGMRQRALENWNNELALTRAARERTQPTPLSPGQNLIRGNVLSRADIDALAGGFTPRQRENFMYSLQDRGQLPADVSSEFDNQMVDQMLPRRRPIATLHDPRTHQLIYPEGYDGPRAPWVYVAPGQAPAMQPGELQSWMQPYQDSDGQRQFTRAPAVSAKLSTQAKEARSQRRNSAALIALGHEPDEVMKQTGANSRVVARQSELAARKANVKDNAFARSEMRKVRMGRLSPQEAAFRIMERAGVDTNSPMAMLALMGKGGASLAGDMLRSQADMARISAEERGNTASMRMTLENAIKDLPVYQQDEIRRRNPQLYPEFSGVPSPTGPTGGGGATGSPAPIVRDQNGNIPEGVKIPAIDQVIATGDADAYLNSVIQTMPNPWYFQPGADKRQWNQTEQAEIEAIDELIADLQPRIGSANQYTAKSIGAVMAKLHARRQAAVKRQKEGWESKQEKSREATPWWTRQFEFAPT